MNKEVKEILKLRYKIVVLEYANISVDNWKANEHSSFLNHLFIFGKKHLKRMDGKDLFERNQLHIIIQINCH